MKFPKEFLWGSDIAASQCRWKNPYYIRLWNCWFAIWDAHENICG